MICPHCKTEITFNKPNLTPKQLEVLKYLKSYFKNKGYMPILFDIMDEFKISQTSANTRLKQLIRKGYIERKKNFHRGVNILE